MDTIIRVISIAGHPRRSAFHPPPPELGLRWEYMDAATELIEGVRVDIDMAYKNVGRQLTPGEIAVFCSHIKCWRNFLSGSQASQMIVLEDDVYADWHFVKHLTLIDWKSIGVDYLKLYQKNPALFWILRWSYPLKDRHLVQFRTLANGANAYLISRSAASTFCDMFSVIGRPIDLEIERPWHTKIPVIGIVPSGVIELTVPSTIKGREGAHFNPLWKPAYYFFRGCEHINACLYRIFGRSAKIK